MCKIKLKQKFSATWRRIQNNHWKGESTKQLLTIAYKYGAVAHKQESRPYFCQY